MKMTLTNQILKNLKIIKKIEIIVDHLQSLLNIKKRKKNIKKNINLHLQSLEAEVEVRINIRKNNNKIMRIKLKKKILKIILMNKQKNNLC